MPRKPNRTEADDETCSRSNQPPLCRQAHSPHEATGIRSPRAAFPAYGKPRKRTRDAGTIQHWGAVTPSWHPRFGSRTSGAERRTFLLAAGVRHYQRFGTSTLHSLRYHGTSTLKCRCAALAPQRAKLPTSTSESQVGRNWIQSSKVGSLPGGLKFFARRSISRGVPGARLKEWLVSKSVGRN